MYRKDLIPLLENRMVTVEELAELFEARPRDIELDLAHLLKSLKRSSYRVTIEPARCRKCGFRLKHERLSKPGKCPRCRSTWIAPPRIGLKAKGSS